MLSIYILWTQECFERGIVYLADECRQAIKSGEYLRVKKEDHDKVKQFFNNRIELTETLFVIGQ